MRRIENREVLPREQQQFCARAGQMAHFRLVLAHQPEQRAHLRRSRLRLPACLQRAEGSAGACVFG